MYEDARMTIPVSLADRIYEFCWSACSKFERHLSGHPDLPQVDRTALAEAFEALLDLADEASRQAPPKPHVRTGG